MTTRASLLFILAASTCACATTAPTHADDVAEYGAQLFGRTPAALSIAASRSLADLGYTVDSVDYTHVSGHRAALSETFIDAVAHGPAIARSVDVEIVAHGGGASYVVVVPRVFANGRDITEDPSARAGEVREMQSILAYTGAELPPDFDSLCFLLQPFHLWWWYGDDDDMKLRPAAGPLPTPVAPHGIIATTAPQGPVRAGAPIARVGHAQRAR